MAETDITTYAIRHDQCVEMINVGWGGLKSFRRARRSRTRPKIIYLQGNLLLIAPSFPHERLRERLWCLVHEVVVGLRSPFLALGQTMLDQRRKEVAIEPDFSYYLENEPIVQTKPTLNLAVDPPPDLVVQIVRDRAAAMSVRVLRRLGVPEVWVCDGKMLQILALRGDGRYSKVDRSRAFPSLECSEIAGWLHAPQGGSDLDWCLALRRWVETVLIARVQARVPSSNA